MNAVECTGLTKKYGGSSALDSFDATIAEGRITGLIGRNGAGKTTLLKLIAGYLRPSQGAVSVFGKKPFNNLEISQNLIFVDEHMAFPGELSLTEIVHEMARFYEKFDEKLALRLLEYHALNEKQRHAKLSKGMRSTFNAMIGIAAHCPLTLYDEPTSGMDTAARKDFYRALLKDYIACPRTIVLSSHLLGELSGLLEDILLIDSGKTVALLSADEAATYAVGLRGKKETVEAAAGTRQVLYREEFAGGVSLAVRNDYAPGELEKAKAAGIEILSVSAADLCIYLTQKDKGGIDNVFSGEPSAD